MTSTADAPSSPSGAAFERLVDALHTADCAPRTRGNTHVDARCPAHDDKSPSLSADWHAELRSGASGVLVCCHAGCDPSDIADALDMVHPNDWFDTPIYRQVGDARSAPRRKSTRKSKKPAEKKPAPKTHLGTPTAVYTYVDEHGEILGEVQRYEHGVGATALPEGRGKTFRWRRPGARGGMVWGSPERRPLYHLPAVLAAARSGETVYVVEGEKDVEALESAGAVATCNPGGAGKWLPEHTAALGGAQVVIVADRDPQGRSHASRVADALEGVAAGVRVVEPAVRDDHADAAAHLQAGYGLDEFVDAVLPGVEPSPGAGDADGEGPGATVHQLDVARRSRGADDDRRGGDGSGSGGGGDLPILRVARDQYTIIDGSLCKVEHSKKGEPYAREVLNGVVRLASRIRRDMGDGAPLRVSHVDLEAHKGDVASEIRGVEWAEFERVTWSADLPWSDVIYNRTHAGRSALVNAVLQTSGDVPVITSYGTLGWREIDGRWVYIHGGGALGVNGPEPDVRTDLNNGHLSKYVQPDAPADPEELRTCLQASLELMDRLPSRVAAPLLGAAYRAPLGETSPNATVFLLGRQYSYKSALAALALSHFKPTASYDDLTVGAGEDDATGNALEEIRYEAGNSLVAIDDLAPDRGPERAAQRANRLGRSQYNRSGKARQDRKGGLRPTHKPRSLLILTGEDGASSESASTRMMHIPLSQGVIDFEVVRALSTRKLGYRRARWTSAYIGYLAARMPLDEWVSDTHTQMQHELMNPAATETGLEARTSDLLASMATGWRAALDAAVELEALTHDEAQAMWHRAWAGLLEAKEAQFGMVSGQDVITRTAELLRTALMSGAAHVRTKSTNGQPDAATQLWGWEASPVSVDGADAARARGDMIGWLDGDHVLFDKHATFAVIERAGRASSEPLGITAKALADALVGAGIAPGMSEQGQSRNYVRRRAAGALRDVWEVPVAWLYPEGSESDRPTPDDAPSPSTPGTPSPDAPAPAPATGSMPAPQTAPEAPEGPTVATADAAPTRAHQAPVNAAQGNSAPKSKTSERSQSRASWGDRDHDVFAVVVSEDAPVAVGRKSGVQDITQVTTAPPLDAGLPGLLDWAAELEMGWTYEYRPPEDGQVWITPAAAERLGLGDPPKERTGELSEEERAFAGDEPTDEDHPLLHELEAAGWQVSKAGINKSGWITTWKGSGRTLRVTVIGWQLLNYQTACPLLDEQYVEDSYFLGYRMVEFARKVNMPWHISGGVTGVDLMDMLRPRGSRQGLKKPVDPPPPAKKRTLEEDIVWWTRKPERWEAEKQYAHLIDKHGMHLGPAGSLSLGTAGWVHLDHPEFDPKLPAYWRVRISDLVWEDPFWPNPFNPNQREQEDTVELATPILGLAAKELEREIHPIEAYAYPEHSRCLEKWQKHLRTAREPLVGDEDPDVRMLLDSVKRLYTGSIGKMGAESMAGSPRYRPDHRHHIVSAARANLMRDLIKIRGVDPWLNPLAVATDAMVFVSNEPDPEKAIPVNFGPKLGQYEAVGSVEFTEIQKFFYMTRSELRQRRRAGELGMIETMKGREL